MATTCAILLLTLAIILISIRPSIAEIRYSKIHLDNRRLITFNEFGYTHNGYLELNVSGLVLSPTNTNDDLSGLGFFLSTRVLWDQVLKQYQDREITCPLESKHVRLVYGFESLRRSDASSPNFFNHSVQVIEPGDFILLFANCLPTVKISMGVRSSMYNINTMTSSREYLSAGKTPLPWIYFLFFIAYTSLAGFWIYVLFKKRASVFRIHYFMLAVVVLKALNLVCEAEDKSYIERTGSPHGWDVLFYIISFLKGITLFTLLVLIGTGWSFLKPYLQDREKKVLIVVIPLQVIANIAQVAIDEGVPYARAWITWSQVFLLVDVVCCCAVLFPIVWSIKNLREAARTDGKAAAILMKLTLFRHYYVVVICYIYFTRVVVYALKIITSYRYAWIPVVAGELATLAFYVFTGYKFKPETHNPYFVVDDEEDDEAMENLKGDEFEF